MNHSQMEDYLKGHLEVNIPFRIPEFKDRIRVWAEVDKYRPGEDESVWKQKKGKSPHAYEIYFDGEFVCFFDENETIQRVILKFIESMRELFKQEKIFVNKEMYVVKEEERKSKEEEILLENPTTPEDKILTDVVVKQAKKRKRKVRIKK